jgi:hypothetical protein
MFPHFTLAATASAVAAAGAGNGRKLRKALSLPSLGAAARSRRSLLQAGTGALVCDGTVRQLDMPAGPYATREQQLQHFAVV